MSHDCAGAADSVDASVQASVDASAPVTVRELAAMAEFRAAEDLQREVWGRNDPPDPADLMMVIQSEGGLVGGAFADGRLLGYVFGFPTRHLQVQHSHRLAVRAQARGMGVGLRLKRFQRLWCLERGITLVRWTFDPLRAANAALNLHRLGAVSDTYLPDYYGAMGGINHGVVSDRLLVEWHLAAPAVRALAEGRSRPAQRTAALDPVLPEDFGALLAQDPIAAEGLREAQRRAMQQAFATGRQVVDYDPSSRRYLVSWPSD